MTDLREALAARPDDDFVVSAPERRSAPVRRRTAPARPKARREPGVGARLLLIALDHPRQIFATVFLTGCAGIIAWNALVHQTVRHPAPLFGHASSRPAEPAAPAQAQAQAQAMLPPARPSAPAPFEGQPQEPAVPTHASVQAPAAPAAAPVPAAPPAPARPPARSALSDLINGRGDITQPQRVVAAPPPPARAPADRDPIADIIRMGGPVPVPPGNVGRTDSGDPVLSGQQALARLGYGVKADGVMGSETRQAIERFEHDRHLPVTGEFSPRTVRELTSLSGIPVP